MQNKNLRQFKDFDFLLIFSYHMLYFDVLELFRYFLKNMTSTAFKKIKGRELLMILYKYKFNISILNLDAFHGFLNIVCLLGLLKSFRLGTVETSTHEE